MATNRSEFSIDIKTTSDASGVTKTKEKFGELKDEIGKIKTGQDEAGEAGEKAGEKQAEGAKHAELSHRELHESVHAVAREFGGLADVGLWLNPMTAGLAASLFLIGKIKDALSECTAYAQDLATATEQINAAKVKAFADAARAAADNLEAIFIEEGKLDGAYARGDTAIDNRIKKYGAEIDATLKVEEAKEAAYEAEVKRQVALGTISKERGAELIENAKLQLEMQRGATDQSKLQQEIAEREKQLREASMRLMRGTDTDAIRKAQAAEAPLESDLAGKNEAVKQAQEEKRVSVTIPDITDISGKSTLTDHGTLDELKAKRRDAIISQQTMEEGGNMIQAEQQKAIAAAYDDAIKQQEKYIANLQKEADEAKQKLDVAKAATSEADEQFKKDAELDRSGSDRLKQLQDQLELQKRTNEQVQMQHAARARTEAQTGRIEEAGRVAAGQGTPAENADIHGADARNAIARERGPAANQDAYDTKTSAEQILWNLQSKGRGQGTPDDMAQIAAIHEKILGMMENTQEAHAANWGSFLSRLDALEQKLSNQQTQIQMNRNGQ